MVVKIRLDTQAVRDIISKDPEFRLEIQRAVIQNIVDGACYKIHTQGFDRIHNEVSIEIKDIVSKAVSRHKAEITKQAKKEIMNNQKTKVTALVDREVKKQIKEKVNAALNLGTVK